MKRRLTFTIALALMLVLMLSSCVSVYFWSQLAGSEKVETAEQALEYGLIDRILEKRD